MRAIQERRIKISELEDLNDPFEGMPFDLTTPYHRDAVTRSRSELGAKYGFLCFSAAWTNPVLWAHYADKHRGICLGIETDYDLSPVSYLDRRVPFKDPPDLPIAEIMHFGKANDWQYENEIRCFAALNEKSNGHYFMSFDERLRLVEVIVGVRSVVTKHRLQRALGNRADTVTMRKARLSYDTFAVVEDENGLQWLMCVESEEYVERARRVNVSLSDVPLAEDHEYWRDAYDGARYIQNPSLTRFKKMVCDAEYEHRKRNREGYEVLVKWATAVAAIIGATASVYLALKK